MLAAFFIKAISRLPLWFLYGVSDLLFFVAYRLVGYRKAVVHDNLVHAFPDKSLKEIKAIEKEFYLNFTDYLVESLKFLTMSNEQLLKRTSVKGSEWAKEQLEQGRPQLWCVSHTFNWEWALHAGVKFFGQPFDPIYQKQANPAMDKLILDVRSRNGCRPIEKDVAVKEVIKHVKEGRSIAIVADQSPPLEGSDRIWVNFFGREVPFYFGLELFKKMLNMEAVFLKVRKPKRGMYEYRFVPFGPDEKNRDEKGAWIKAFAREIEKQVTEEPALYLWTHKRWKHAREVQKD